MAALSNLRACDCDDNQANNDYKDSDDNDEIKTIKRQTPSLGVMSVNTDIS